MKDSVCKFPLGGTNILKMSNSALIGFDGRSIVLEHAPGKCCESHSFPLHSVLQKNKIRENKR